MHTNPSDEKEDKEIKKFMLSNSEFTTSIINYAVILSNSNKGALDYEYINEGISLIEEKLRSFKEEFFYNPNYIGSFCKNIQLINHEDNYKNYCLIKCVDRVYNLEKNLNILKRTMTN